MQDLRGRLARSTLTRNGNTSRSSDGNILPKYGDISWKPASWSASAVVSGLWGYMLYVGVNDPLGGIYQLFPLFGIATQLLAAIALALCVTLIQARQSQVRLGSRHRPGLG